MEKKQKRVKTFKGHRSGRETKARVQVEIDVNVIVENGLFRIMA
jgi:hypothetical protein